MMRKAFLKAIAGSILTCCLIMTAQEKGTWRAVSSTARSITGDIAISEEKLTINFLNFTIAQIRRLDPKEINAVFEGTNAATGSGNLYRLDIPATKKFLRKNSLCGADDTEWMATFASGRSLQLAFFSGDKPPLFTPEALATSTNLCGTYSYVK
jgi:hypothetical protein